MPNPIFDNPYLSLGVGLLSQPTFGGGLLSGVQLGRQGQMQASQMQSEEQDREIRKAQISEIKRKQEAIQRLKGLLDTGNAPNPYGPPTQPEVQQRGLLGAAAELAPEQIITSLLSPKENKYSNVQVDDLGNVWGLNGQGQFVPVPQAGAPATFKTVQGFDAESGVPVQSLVNPRTGEKITVSEGAKKALPTEAQDALSQSFDAFKALDIMERNINETGLIYGNTVGRLGAATGWNKAAVDFQTARSNMKLAAQALIKGIPSNFDVQTVIDTLPEIGKPETVNKSRIDFSRQLLRNLVERTIAYYKGTNTPIPPRVKAEARRSGIDISGIAPWDGSGDPLMVDRPSLDSFEE